MKNKFILLVLFCNLVLTYGVNIHSITNSYHEFYDLGDAYKAEWYYQPVKELVQNEHVMNYASLTGFDTGYGFFAPNVCSQMLIEYNVMDDNNKLVAKTEPIFKQNESSQRFTTCYSEFVNAFFSTKKNQTYLDSLKTRVSTAMINSCGKNIGKTYPNASKVVADLYLYEYPSLAATIDNRKIRFIKFKSLTIQP